MTRCRNSFSLDGCGADRANLMFTAVLGTSSVGVSYPLAVGMTSSGNSFGLDRCVTYGTFLVLTAIFGASGVSINNPLAVSVARRNVVLCYKRFATNGTMLTLGLAVRGASSGYSGINSLGMTSCINTFSFLFTARASAFLFSLNGTSSILNCCPFTKCVNVVFVWCLRLVGIVARRQSECAN